MHEEALDEFMFVIEGVFLLGAETSLLLDFFVQLLHVFLEALFCTLQLKLEFGLLLFYLLGEFLYFFLKFFLFLVEVFLVN